MATVSWPFPLCYSRDQIIPGSLSLLLLGLKEDITMVTRLRRHGWCAMILMRSRVVPYGVCLLFVCFFPETSCGDPQMQTGEEEEGWEIVRRSKRR